MLAVTLWAVTAWYFGIPTSESHAMLSGIGGAAVALGGVGALNAAEWGRVAVGLLVSTLPAFLSGYFVFRLTAVICRRQRRGDVMPFFVFGQKIGAASSAYLHGLQDGQKFMGIMMLCVSLGRGVEWERPPLGVAMLCAAVMAFGTAMGGSRIIKKVAMDMVSLDAARGFCADVSASAILLICTLLGLPVSTTHAKTCAVMGAGRACRRGGLDRSAVREMVAAWLITFPLCFALGFGAVKLLLII
jgi:PiT family inorganic phosphate transporter